MKVLIFINHSLALYKFRRELPQMLLQSGHEVVVCYPNNDKDSFFEKIGCRVVHFGLERKSTNPFKEISNIASFRKLCKRINPDCLLTYTIKCCLYGSFAPKRIRKIATVTGQSGFFKGKGLLKSVLYKTILMRFKKYDFIFFQNQRDRLDFAAQLPKAVNRFVLVPGSGVNPEEHPYQGKLKNDPFIFFFVGRLIKEKGINEFLSAAKRIKNANVHFVIAGPSEDDDILRRVRDAESERLTYVGDLTDINSFYKKCTVVVVPSYSEGMSNALLEAQASGRPTIGSDIPGCKETMIPGVSGVLVEPRDHQSLYDAMMFMIGLSERELNEMGVAGREYVLSHFSRDKVISAYLEKINTFQ